MNTAVGPLLREWRLRKRLSQLELSAQTGVSSRHLSFIETGRSKPSRELLLQLGAHLDVPLRERNHLLSAAGYSPEYRGPLLSDAETAAVRSTLTTILEAHGSNPALVVDRRWTVVDANAATGALLSGVAPELLAPPVNSLRVALHPLGLAPHIVNLPQWRTSVLRRLQRQIETSDDSYLRDLYSELRDYPGGLSEEISHHDHVAVPLVLEVGRDQISLLMTVATFGTPVDVTVSELVIESFFAADAISQEALRRLVQTTDAEFTSHILDRVRGG